MNSIPTRFAAIIAIGLLGGSVAPSHSQTPVAAPASFTVVSPVFGQLVRFSMPTRFTAVFENTKDAFYIREAVLKGETANQWSQMITITGARGLASSANFSPRNLAGLIAEGFRKACPESFVAKGFGETKLGSQDAFVAMASCGTVGADKHSETALIVTVKGHADAYTIQWAERAAMSSSGTVIDEAKWQGRLRELMPIRLCAIFAGEAAPYPSCLQQK